MGAPGGNSPLKRGLEWGTSSGMVSTKSRGSPQCLSADEHEIEQYEVGETGRAEVPVAEGSWPPDPEEDGQEHGVG